MKETTNTQRKILEAMCEEQVRLGHHWMKGEDESAYYVNDDETPLYTYKYLSSVLELPEEELRSAMIAMRDEQLVQLIPAVDLDEYRPKGSGWCITEKGIQHALSLGITPDV